MKNVNRAFIVTDKTMVDLGFVNKITEQLNLRKLPVVEPMETTTGSFCIPEVFTKMEEFAKKV